MKDCSADLILNLGVVAKLDTPNHFLAINGIARRATVLHQLRGANSCVAQCLPALSSCPRNTHGNLQPTQRPNQVQPG